MTKEEWEELGRRTVKCRHWRWIPGSWWFVPFCDDLGGRYRGLNIDERAIPDLRDPATLGCLLHLVREAWGDGHIVQFGGWCRIAVYDRVDAEEAWKHGDTDEPVWCSVGGHKSDGEALVAALEAAP